MKRLIGSLYYLTCFIFLSVLLSSCTTTKYILKINDHDGDYTKADSLYINNYVPQECLNKDGCVRLNINDLNDFNEAYEYGRIKIYTNGKEELVSFGSLQDNLAKGINKIDSVRIDGGKGITSESFMRGAIYGLAVFLIAPPLSYLSTDKGSHHMSYGVPSLVGSLVTCLLLSVVSDALNKEMLIYPTTISETKK